MYRQKYENNCLGHTTTCIRGIFKAKNRHKIVYSLVIII